MNKTLLKNTFVFRVESEDHATQLIEQQKQESEGSVTYKVDRKTKKSKGEIIDEFWVVTITHDFTT